MQSFLYFKIVKMQNNLNNPNKIISVAPMMAYTDRHCRYFHRLLSKDVLLYTEMITTGALIFGDREHYLQPELLPGPVSCSLVDLTQKI